jgi:hypothetical protein
MEESKNECNMEWNEAIKEERGRNKPTKNGRGKQIEQGLIDPYVSVSEGY